MSDQKPAAPNTDTIPATFSTLLISLASSAIMAMGLEKDPSTGKYEKDLKLARFNVDMLKLVKDKTKGNLEADEQQFLDSVINDLQLKFVYASQNS